MKIKIRTITFLLLFGLISSCAIFQSKTERNFKKTEFLFEKLLNENGNVFAITVANTPFSRVWTYQNSEIKIFDIANGQINETRTFDEINSEWIYSLNDDDEMMFDKCLELDGDGLKYSIKKDKFVNKNNLPINIKCFVKIKNQNLFYTQLASDISKYELQLY